MPSKPLLPLALLLALPPLLAQTTLPTTNPSTLPTHGDHPAATYPPNVPPPVITDKFTADPHAIIIGDTCYIYPTVDKENWQTTEFNVWSSKDLVHWKNQGTILDLAGTATGHADVSWAKIRAWAPGVAAKDGKVYFYFCGEQKIGVAVADSPTGPFKDALGKPLIQPGGTLRGQQIDPCPFIDSDGTPYLFWGNTTLYAQKLNPDMISLAGDPARLTPTIPGSRFNEGIFVFKRNDLYYFMWSENDARSDDYRVSYGTAPSPLGPITVAADRIILKKSGLVKGTGHHSVINLPNTDDWYIVYHRHAVPGGSGFIRETCMSKMSFSPDGKILPVDVTTPAFPENSPGIRITK